LVLVSCRLSSRRLRGGALRVSFGNCLPVVAMYSANGCEGMTVSPFTRGLSDMTFPLSGLGHPAPFVGCLLKRHCVPQAGVWCAVSSTGVGGLLVLMPRPTLRARWSAGYGQRWTAAHASAMPDSSVSSAASLVPRPIGSVQHSGPDSVLFTSVSRADAEFAGGTAFGLGSCRLRTSFRHLEDSASCGCRRCAFWTSLLRTVMSTL